MHSLKEKIFKNDNKFLLNLTILFLLTFFIILLLHSLQGRIPHIERENYDLDTAKIIFYVLFFLISFMTVRLIKFSNLNKSIIIIIMISIFLRFIPFLRFGYLVYGDPYYFLGSVMFSFSNFDYPKDYIFSFDYLSEWPLLRDLSIFIMEITGISGINFAILFIPIVGGVIIPISTYLYSKNIIQMEDTDATLTALAISFFDSFLFFTSEFTRFDFGLILISLYVLFYSFTTRNKNSDVHIGMCQVITFLSLTNHPITGGTIFLINFFICGREIIKRGILRKIGLMNVMLFSLQIMTFNNYILSSSIFFLVKDLLFPLNELPFIFWILVLSVSLLIFIFLEPIITELLYNYTKIWSIKVFILISYTLIATFGLIIFLSPSNQIFSSIDVSPSPIGVITKFTWIFFSIIGFFDYSNKKGDIFPIYSVLLIASFSLIILLTFRAFLFRFITIYLVVSIPLAIKGCKLTYNYVFLLFKENLHLSKSIKANEDLFSLILSLFLVLSVLNAFPSYFFDYNNGKTMQTPIYTLYSKEDVNAVEWLYDHKIKPLLDEHKYIDITVCNFPLLYKFLEKGLPVINYGYTYYISNTFTINGSLSFILYQNHIRFLAFNKIYIELELKDESNPSEIIIERYNKDPKMLLIFENDEVSIYENLWFVSNNATINI